MATQTKIKSTGKSTGRSVQEKTLSDLLIMKLQVLFDVEQQLIKALPAVAKHATEPDLRQAVQDHLEQTKQHAERLEEAFRMLGVGAKKMQGDAIRGLVSDTEWIIKNIKGTASLDANLIAAAQYVEHYEIAGYGSAIAWAKLLGQDDVAELLGTTLDEEKQANDLLTEIAESKINEQAAEATTPPSESS